MVTTANRMPTIQKRAVILDSGMFCFWKWWWSGAMRKTLRPSPYFFLVWRNHPT